MPVFKCGPGYDPFQTEAILITCGCGVKEHMLKFSYWPDEEWPELFFEFHLSTYRNVLRRLWVAIRYIFGYRCRYGEWDEFTMEPMDARDLAEFLIEYAGIATNQRNKTNDRQREEGERQCRKSTSASPLP
jgi:hypothetical protein